MEQAAMIRANLAGMVLFLAMTACAGAAKQVQAPQAKQEAKKDAKPVAANEKNIVCHMERPTGSNIPERVCRYVISTPTRTRSARRTCCAATSAAAPGP